MSLRLIVSKKPAERNVPPVDVKKISGKKRPSGRNQRKETSLLLKSHFYKKNGFPAFAAGKPSYTTF